MTLEEYLEQQWGRHRELWEAAAPDSPGEVALTLADAFHRGLLAAFQWCGTEEDRKKVEDWHPSW